MSESSSSINTFTPLSVKYYEQSTDLVARDLLGKLVVRQVQGSVMTARIVEVEAYFGKGDPASHACRGVTPRNAIMFGRAGTAYVYLNYGVHHLLNVVTERKGCAGAVLIRAVEPVSGIDEMMRNRRVDKLTDLTSGPGKLTKALGIDMKENGLDLTDRDNSLFVVDDLSPVHFSIISTPRIGISAGKDLLLRFFIEGNLYVSR